MRHRAVVELSDIKRRRGVAWKDRRKRPATVWQHVEHSTHPIGDRVTHMCELIILF